MNALLKFFIGFIAGICTAFLPRLTAALSVSGKTTSLNFFDITYVVISLFFAVLIGGVIMILEWGVARKPRDTSMAALSIPALITGAINTATIAKDFTEVRRDEKGGI